MEALPGFLLEGRKQLDPARVPPIFAQTVAKQNAGIVEINFRIGKVHCATLIAIAS